MTLWGWLLFAFALIASIMLHEAGHMTFARKAGGKVTEFFVGFGPKIWSFRKGETEYGVKAIPAGGYVKIVGMTDLEPIEPEDEPRAFYTKPLGWRLITLAAGSLVHFAIALVLFTAVPLFWGNSSYPATVGGVSSCSTVGVVRAIIGLTGREWPGAGWSSATRPQPARPRAAKSRRRERFMRSD